MNINRTISIRSTLRTVAILVFAGLCVAALALCQTNVANGGDAYPIDLTTALRLAGSNSLKIAEAEAQLREASGEKLSSYERFFPSLSAEWQIVKHEYRDQSTEGVFLDVDKQYHRTAGRIEAEWDLNESLFAVLAARRRHSSAEHQRNSMTDSALLEVANAYFSLAQASANVRIGRKATSVSEDFLLQTERSMSEGVGFEVDRLRARTQLAHDQFSHRQAEEDASIASARLARLLNLDEPVTLTPRDTVLSPLALVDTTESAETWIDQASRIHPDALQRGSELAATRLEKTQAIWGPLLPEIKGQALFANLGPTLSDLQRSRDYSVSVRWTIGPGGLLDLGKIRSRSARADIAQARYEHTLKSVAEGVIRTHSRLRSRGAMLTIASEGLDAAQETLRLAQGRRELGIGLALEVITAADALKRAETDYARAVIDYNRVQIEALAALGQIQQSPSSN